MGVVCDPLPYPSVSLVRNGDNEKKPFNKANRLEGGHHFSAVNAGQSLAFSLSQYFKAYMS